MHATNDMLAKDLYTLAGKFSGFEGQMDELREIVTSGFARVHERLDQKFGPVEDRLRALENTHAVHAGKSVIVSWLIDLGKVLIAATAGAVGGHFFK